MNKVSRGLLIAVEGIDGAGKSTQIPRIADFFKSLGFTVCTTAEPTRGQFGLEIRQATERLSPSRERQLFVDDRKEHLKTCILPELDLGHIVITDRYFYSSIAYQGTRRDAFDHSPSDDELNTLQIEVGQENRAFAPEADILILFRLDVERAFERMKSGREKLEPFETQQTLSDVYVAFERIAQNHPHVIVVDASKPIDAVTQQILDELNTLLPKITQG